MPESKQVEVAGQMFVLIPDMEGMRWTIGNAEGVPLPGAPVLESDGDALVAIQAWLGGHDVGFREGFAQGYAQKQEEVWVALGLAGGAPMPAPGPAPKMTVVCTPTACKVVPAVEEAPAAPVRVARSAAPPQPAAGPAPPPPTPAKRTGPTRRPAQLTLPPGIVTSDHAGTVPSEPTLKP